VPVPGDLIVENASGSEPYGHVAIVDSVTGGTINAVEQNASVSGRHTYFLSGTTVTGAYSSVRGIDHAPNNGNSNPGGGGPSGPPSTLGSDQNLLLNGSFEDGGFAAWNQFVDGPINYYARPDGAGAREGSRYGTVETDAVSRSFSQDVGVGPKPGETYELSMWMRSDDGKPFAGTLALWALGGAVETQPTNFTVGRDWQLVSVPLTVSGSGHTAMRSQVYLGATGRVLDVDGAELIRSRLVNGSFEQGSFAGWGFFPDGSINYTSSGDDPSAPAGAKEGNGYGEAETDFAGRSFAQDLGVAPAAGSTYTFSAWLRSPTGRPFSGVLALWALGGNNEVTPTTFTVGRRWSLVSVPLSVNAAGHNALRAQVYLNTTGINLNVDGAQLTENHLVNGSWEQGSFTGWASFPDGPLSYVSSRDDPSAPAIAHEGGGYGEVATAVNPRSFAQDVGVGPQPGQSYTYSVWVRSSSAARISGTLALWALGGSNENDATPFTAGPTWTQVSAPLYPTQSGHTALRAQLYVATTGVNLYVDGGTLAGGNDRYAPYAPVLVAGPTVSGNATVGATITCSDAIWDDAPDRVITQWLRDGQSIGAGSGAAYVVAAGDQGHELGCAQTATNDGAPGPTTAQSQTKAVPEGPPTAAYTPSTYTPGQGQTVSFNGTASSDPDGTIVSYRWVWGDGTPDGSGATPTHVFVSQGKVSVGLYVTDSDGRTAAVGHGITISAA
jgi:hypothetical protein